MARINESVQVIATRTAEPPPEIPVSTEVITGEELNNLGATDLRSALALAVGVDVARGGMPGLPVRFLNFGGCGNSMHFSSSSTMFPGAARSIRR